MPENGNPYQLVSIVQQETSLANSNYSIELKIEFDYLCIDRAIPERGTLKLVIKTDGCKKTENEVNYLEHVQAFVTLKSTRRGNTVMFLTSPSGTRSVLQLRSLSDDPSFLLDH